MLVKLRRNWFGPNGVQYRPQDGLAEVSDEFRDQLPSDAEIVSDKGMPFDTGKPKLPGFGAKPAHELVMDEVPNAAPTHLITEAAGEGQTSGPRPPRELTPEEEKNLTPAQKRVRADQQKAVDQAVAEEKKATEAGLARAKEKAELVEEKKLDL